MRAFVRKSSNQKKRNTLEYLVRIIQEHKSSASVCQKGAGAGSARWLNLSAQFGGQEGAQELLTTVTSEQGKVQGGRMDRITSGVILKVF